MSCAVFADEIVGQVDIVETLTCAFGNLLGRSEIGVEQIASMW